MQTTTLSLTLQVSKIKSSCSLVSFKVLLSVPSYSTLIPVPTVTTAISALDAFSRHALKPIYALLPPTSLNEHLVAKSILTLSEFNAFSKQVLKSTGFL